VGRGKRALRQVVVVPETCTLMDINSPTMGFPTEYPNEVDISPFIQSAFSCNLSPKIHLLPGSCSAMDAVGPLCIPTNASAKKSRSYKALFGLARFHQTMQDIPALLGLAGKHSKLAGSYKAS